MSYAAMIAREAVIVKIELDLRFCLTQLLMLCHFRQRKIDITGCLENTVSCAFMKHKFTFNTLGFRNDLLSDYRTGP